MIAKVTGSKSGGSKPYRKEQQDPNDLRHFLERGTLVRYGGRKPQYHPMYSHQ